MNPWPVINAQRQTAELFSPRAGLEKSVPLPELELTEFSTVFADLRNHFFEQNR